MQENKEDSVEELKSEEVVVETKKVSPEDDDIAMAKADGWNPDDPKGLTAREFNLRGPLIKTISEINKEKKRQAQQIEELSRTLAGLNDKLSKSEERAFKREAHEIHRQKLEAVEYGDRAKFEAAEKAYAELQDSIRPDQQVVAPQVSPDAQAFMDRNADWFNTDTVENHLMKKEAINFEKEYLEERQAEGKPPLTHAVLGKRIEEYIKLKYPHRFENPEKEKPAAVASGKTSSVDKQETASLDDLTPHQQEVFKRMKHADPSMTVDKYQKSLTMRGLKIE